MLRMAGVNEADSSGERARSGVCTNLPRGQKIQCSLLGGGHIILQQRPIRFIYRISAILGFHLVLSLDFRQGD